MRWRRTSIDQILASAVVGSIGLAEFGGSIWSMGMKSVAEDVRPSSAATSPALGPGEFGLGHITEWSGFVEVAHGTNAHGIKVTVAQLLLRS